MKLFKILSGLSIITICVVFFASKIFLSYWHTPIKALQTATIVSVASGSNFRELALKLNKKDLMPWPRLSILWVRLFEPNFVLKAGEFQLPALASPAQILDVLNRGVSLQYKLTLIEGDNGKQMLAKLLNASAFASDQSASLTVEKLNNSLSPLAIEYMQGNDNPEGWFLPDTYFYAKDDSLLSVLNRAHLAMLEALDAEWAERAEGLPYQSAYDALIMASLVEKETGVAYERPKIAGVFVRRLQKGMRLQTDPTVIYGMGERYNGNLRRADLKQDTAYNTYTRHGLPPTPIAMPGRAAIYAALHPLDGTELYFVAKGDGSHYFSTTFKEHQAAVQKYQVQKRRADYRSTPLSPSDKNQSKSIDSQG